MSRSALLLAELRAYAAHDETELSNVAALESLLHAAGEEAFSRENYVPGHVTASAFVVDRQGRLLLHHHRTLDRWLQLGGHLDPGEEPAAAALREAREESGLTELEPAGESFFDVDVHPIPRRVEAPLHNHFDLRYLFIAPSAAGLTPPADESQRLAWFPMERAAALVDDAGCERAILKISRLPL
jgi:8-oxo-dGTP pyrophosphatase MutT (NUDIX family)